jgi:branched-chain amino acid transport system ATP-binding protein
VSVALTVTDLSVGYGGLVANDRVSLEVRAGQVVGLIGPNGAGKSTFVDAV